MSVSALLNSGYTVSSYGNGSVFVSNVPMLGMSWPDAILFYNNGGGLCGSRFMYPTTYYDPYRYNTAYNMLVNTYGAPVNVINNASGMEATWWGTNNQFIRLSFTSQYDSYGNPGYMTSLSFGI